MDIPGPMNAVFLNASCAPKAESDVLCCISHLISYYTHTTEFVNAIASLGEYRFCCSRDRHRILSKNSSLGHN